MLASSVSASVALGKRSRYFCFACVRRSLYSALPSERLAKKPFDFNRDTNEEYVDDGDDDDDDDGAAAAQHHITNTVSTAE